MGSDKKKLLHLLPSQLESRDILCPETKETVVKLWRDFDTLYQLINADPEENENLVVDISEKSKEFIELFCAPGDTRIRYNKLCVTPYMHALSSMFHFSSKKQKAFRQFIGQGVEKNNDDAKRIFFKSQTNGMQLGMCCSWRHDSKHSINVKGRRENMKNKTMNTGVVEL